MGVFFVFDAVSFEAVFDAAPDIAGTTFHFLSWDVDILTTLCLLLFVGAMGKSAQVPLHTWLPDAMEGPTPVSALIHAATMVTAGVFMVVRLSPMFEYAPYALMFVAFIGATTAFFAATVGIAQNDIKRVIAYSTCSQLGYMFFACGVGAYAAAIFHLAMHACFKALLFLGSGQVIHAVHDEQDMRRMGGLWRKIPITYAYMWIGSLALAGIPFFAGYFSKDLIIESAFAAHTGMGIYAYWMGVGGAVLTALYSWRMIFMTFHGRSRMAPDVEAHVHEAPKVMWMPLLILVAGSVIGGFGFMGGVMVAGGGNPFFGDSILVLGPNVIEGAHHIPEWAILVPLVGALSGIAIAFVCYIWRPNLAGVISSMFRPVYLCLLNKYYVDELYDWMFVRPAKRLGHGLWKAIDGSVIDGLGPDGIAAATIDIAKRAKVLQSGYVYHYAFAMLIGVAVVVSWFLFRALG
jgi:NADH-quinone oxidoreductase subunit L